MLQCPQSIAIATCCHYLCTWDTYFGRPVLEAEGLVEEDFTALARLSQWATLSGEGLEGGLPRDIGCLLELRAETYHQATLDRGTMIALGYLGKRLIDLGRGKVLQAAGYASQVLCYTTRSRENGLLLAQWQ